MYVLQIVQIVVKKNTYAKPDSTFIKVVFPAPDGPMMAVSSLGRKSPETFDSIFFLSVK